MSFQRLTINNDHFQLSHCLNEDDLKVGQRDELTMEEGHPPHDREVIGP